MNKIIVIYGPTAIGKTQIAINLAKIINAEIISADSMQIYKDLNIGSAKIMPDEMQGITHHLLNIKDSLETYSAYDFVCDCKKSIKSIQSKGKNVIICGGTGLYIKALTEGYNYGDAQKNQEFREMCKNKTNLELFSMIKEKDITVANSIDINNKHRLIRALEVLLFGTKQTKQAFDNDYVIFGLNCDRQKLYDRINKRVDIMIEQGLLNETDYLLKHGVTDSHQSFKAIGYKELMPYIRGEANLNSCIDKLKQNTRNYAKRQITFMNQFPNIIKVEIQDIQQATNQILNQIEDNKWIN